MFSTAYFVSRPRRYEDLLRPHDVRLERPYRVVRTVTLAPIDYENYTEDLAPSRDFLEGGPFAADGDPVLCLLIRCRGREGGLLVCPDCQGRTALAALYSPEPILDPVDSN